MVETSSKDLPVNRVTGLLVRTGGMERKQENSWPKDNLTHLLIRRSIEN